MAKTHKRTAWLKKAYADFPKCFYCGELTVLFEGSTVGFAKFQATVDHYFPLSRGGLDEPENYRLACMGCNSAKGSLWPTVAAIQGWPWLRHDKRPKDKSEAVLKMHKATLEARLEKERLHKEANSTIDHYLIEALKTLVDKETFLKAVVIRDEMMRANGLDPYEHSSQKAAARAARLASSQ